MSNDLSAFINKGWVQQPDGSFSRGNQARRLASGPVSEPGHVDESLAEDAGETVDQVRCLVRVTSLRKKLVDDDNLFVKHFVDGCKEAGLLVDDSPRWCKIEVSQRLIVEGESECTLIEITPLSDATS